ncbi:hypothetical protein HPB51_000742 [Rhipicephalus microplus]|uniref:ABC transporter domain-containing protein n=1 Tax=Rhipicephalus microplus TaxID=6941 RepID=A0A9J6EVF7_RHIMP|nr:hypothetical protein HPB51_000742 [Rhipicephalus microplus]
MIIGDAIVEDSGNFDHLEFFNVHPNLSTRAYISASIGNVAATAGIRSRDLRVYGKTTVVSNMNLEASKGYITVLLGHNGAGKTTTMRMITGQLAPSSGSVFIESQDVNVNSRAAHESLGVCPQNDIHFRDMTVFEHLYFFSRLKKVPYNDAHEQTFNLLILMNMVSKAYTFAKHLSGGMKRKLSIAIALIGHSKVVILDEPTAGMDPAARRDMWDLLLAEKVQRTILLTTHSMEEADAIGDRIAIMSNGVVQCCGSPFFLKKNLGSLCICFVQDAVTTREVTPYRRVACSACSCSNP